MRNANIFRNGEVQKERRNSDPETPLDPRIWGKGGGRHIVKKKILKKKNIGQKTKEGKKPTGYFNPSGPLFSALGENAVGGAAGKKKKRLSSSDHLPRKVMEQAGI